VDLLGGNDTFTGGNFTDRVVDGDGSDNIKLNGGNDIYTAIGAADTLVDAIDGGTGIDTYSASAATVGILVNLDTASHNFSPFMGPLIGASLSQIGLNVDKITNFENIEGGTKDDFLHGNVAANDIRGNAGADLIFGFTGNDVLRGDAGADVLVGGIGADTLTGGTEADNFTFTSKLDSTSAKSGRDVITDFQDGADKIRFDFDADTTNGAVIDDFSSLVVNASFTGATEQVRVYGTSMGWMVEADINGDKTPDFAVEVADAAHTISWSALDFVF
jgi:serralysin